jgi:hypothetical protein
MSKKKINKIVYFDKETIRNILEERNKGSKSSKKDTTRTTDVSGEIGAEIKIKLGIPFIERLNFLFSGKLKTSFLIKQDNSTFITSTEISEFESIKKDFSVIENTLIYDVENSSTFFRVAGTYLRIVKGGVEGVDTKEFKDVMDSQDGYDTYKINEQKYVRFNNTAFLSNYKRNELLATRMTIYCIPIGNFNKDIFDFMKQLFKMKSLYTNDYDQTLADAFPTSRKGKTEVEICNDIRDDSLVEDIELFDVVYACITAEERE